MGTALTGYKKINKRVQEQKQNNIDIETEWGRR